MEVLKREARWGRLGAGEASMFPEREDWNRVSYRMIGCCFKVHRLLGPGLLESVYEDSVALELARQGLAFVRQYPVPVEYDGEIVGNPLRLDFLVEDTVVLEIKAVETLHNIHKTQLLTYLKLTNRPLGLLINFNTESLRQGIKRVIHTPSFPSV
jgi:GxxExxY protein